MGNLELNTLLLTTHEGLSEFVAREVKAILGDSVRDVKCFENVVEVTVSNLTESVIRLALFGRTFDGIYLKLLEERFERKQDLYTLALKVRWSDLWDVYRPFAVVPDTDGTVNRRDIGTLVGQGIVDHFKYAVGERAKVDLERPQIKVLASVQGRTLLLALDLCGFELNSPEEMLARAVVMASEWDAESPFAEIYYGGVSESAYELARREAMRSRIPNMIFVRTKIIDQRLTLELLRRKWRREDIPRVTCYEKPGRVSVVKTSRRYPIVVKPISDAPEAGDSYLASNLMALTQKKDRQREMLSEILEIFDSNSSARVLALCCRAEIVPDDFEMLSAFRFRGINTAIAVKRRK